MPVQFFGQYLLAKGIIDREQLLEAVAFQESQNFKLGEHAVRSGYLNESQAEQINQMQQAKDMLFGEAAVELKLLSPAQVDELVAIQQNNRVYLGEAIVKKGFASSETIDKALGDFKKEQELFEGEELSATFEGLDLPDPKFCAVSVDLTSKLLLRVWNVTSKPGEARTERSTLSLPGHIVVISFGGQVKGRYVLSVPEPVVVKAAKKILGEDQPNSETRDDLVREFANVVCGNVAASMTQHGRPCDIQPPQSYAGEVSLGRGERAVVVPLLTTEHGSAVVAITYSVS